MARPRGVGASGTITSMSKVQISLDDETFERLKSLAASSHASPEETAARAVREAVSDATGESTQVDSLLSEMLDRYGSVFHRLAQ